MMESWEDINDIGWYSGHMAKAKRYIAENMKLVDMCIELRDSRIPRSSQNPNIQKLIGDKKHIVLLTKSSLSDRNASEQWIRFLRDGGVSAISIDSKTLLGFDSLIKTVPVLMSEKLDQYKRKGLNKPIRAMVLGVTNVGKSTFFNALSRTKKAKVEDRPGVTRNTQWIRTPYNLELLDTPGLLWEKIESRETAFMLAATGAIRDEILDTVEISRTLCVFL
ncbi:MAG TPA: ribosome biogenesis GTPase YlqF, partial [Bacillota bacterium]|nr:ribosome biogenesis GTPase YlqF [Bacillota bacterium]